MTVAEHPGAAVAGALADGVRALGLVLPDGALGKLSDHLALLAKWNRVYNLTAVREPERMVTHHALDSLAALPALDAMHLLPHGARVLDVGSGGGFPGIPLAIARPELRVTLCEPSDKKATFLAQAAVELALANVEVAAVRAEDLRAAQPFDVAISRAFADLATFVGAARPHLAPGGVIVAMKGVVPQEELCELPADVEVVAMPSLRVPGLDATRHLIVMRPAQVVQ